MVDWKNDGNLFYAKGSIPQMMNGHAYSWALRAHFLTKASLSTLLSKHINSTEGYAEEVDGDHLRTVYGGIIKKEVSVNGAMEDQNIQDF